ncbi:MAG: hypothetical protein F4Z15_06705 [Gammaproteobacteria bacterium]|nr:hypothetical protein [Gammaproteobacteria bacterium]
MPRHRGRDFPAIRKAFRLFQCFLVLPVLLGTGAVTSWPVFADTLYRDGAHGLTADLQMVRTLIRAGVLDLAESTLENRSPPALPTEEWLAWERQLWSLYAYRGKWLKLYERSRTIPPAFPAEIQNEADRQAAIALLEQGRGAQARRILRKRIVSAGDSENDFRDIRTLIVESYMVDGMLEDAASAMSRYQHDYRARTEDWVFLSAGIHLALGQPEEAINLLAPLDFPRAKLLNLYARLVHGSISPPQGLERLQDIMHSSRLDNTRTGLRDEEAAAVSVYLGQRIDTARYLDELERYLVLTGAPHRSRDGVFPSYSLPDLLKAYGRHALDIINSQGFLDDEFGRILNFAVSLPDTQLIDKKVLYGYLLQNVKDRILRSHVSSLFVDALIKSQSVGIIPHLFGQDNPFGQLLLIGDVGLAVSNHAIEAGNIQLAAQVIDSLVEPPSDMAPDLWALHVSRVSIMAGRFAAGGQQLRRWIVEQAEMSPEAIDMVLQPVFDLQKAGQHDYALELFGLLRSKVTTERHERELAYWIGESYQATRQYLKAADHFLYSALLKGDGYDQWGQSARYRAAQCLESARLMADARTLYENLRDRTDNEGRRAQLDQKIQLLRLLESGAGTGADTDSL